MSNYQTDKLSLVKAHFAKDAMAQAMINIEDVPDELLTCFSNTNGINNTSNSATDESTIPGAGTIDLSKWSLVVKDQTLLKIVAFYQTATSTLATSQTPPSSSSLPSIQVLNPLTKLTKQDIKNENQSPSKSRIASTSSSSSSSTPYNTTSAINTSITTINKTNHLIKLKLTGSRNITDYGLAKICQIGSEILELDVSDCILLTDHSLRQIGLYCRQIQILNLSNLSSLYGDSLIEISNNCYSTLRKLNVSKCFNLQNFGIINIFNHCTLLQYLNISYLNSITDIEMKILTQHCHQLTHLLLRECIYTSDQTILTISEFCPDLQVLDMSRQTMAFRITDVGLMALGQRSFQLKILKLKGCDHITDVGLHWLSEGCHNLEELDINGCIKVSDAGMRSVGNACHQLQSVDLTNIKSISDVGIRSLSMGCSELKKLSVQGLFLLSDQRYSNASNGSNDAGRAVTNKFKTMKIKASSSTHSLSSTGLNNSANSNTNGTRKSSSAGNNITDINGSNIIINNNNTNLKINDSKDPIGLAALKIYSFKIQELNLTGCFRLNSCIQNQLTGLKNLRVINLTSCTEVTTESLISLVEKCIHIYDINLTDCTQAVNTLFITSLCKSCQYLKSLNVTRCLNIKGGAIKAISTYCRYLQKLDLSGCKNLNDNMMMSLCEDDSVPNLKYLSLIQIRSITDDIIAWLGSKKHKLEHIGLKWTSVSNVGIKAFKDRFPYSDYTDNDTFYGFLPKFRSNDRRFINEYTHIKNSFITTQAMWRGVLARRTTSKLRIIKKEHFASILIQSYIRKYLAKCYYSKLRMNHIHQHNAALIITSIFHIALAKKCMNHIRGVNLIKLKQQSICLLQRTWRIHRDYNILKSMLQFKYNLKMKRYKSCIKIQSAIRMFIAKRTIEKIRILHITRKAIRIRKACIIQKCYRGYAGRLFVKRKRQNIKNHHELIYKYCRIIQYGYHSYKLRKEISYRIYQRNLNHHAAIQLQSFIRGTLARYLYFDMRLAAYIKYKEKCALRIQMRWRMKSANLLLQKLKLLHYEYIQLRHYSATIIQMNVRKMLSRIKLFKLKQEYVEKLKLFMELEISAVIKIQSLYRGNKAREIYHHLLKEKKGRWKELWDDENHQRFFFNQISGEVRYRIPQDLLDLIPRNQCDNCHFYEAKIECAQCHELFCNTCYQQIHYGGKRKNHEFRCLFDYYDKRIDYGDGDAAYPCKWPTEIIQDEIQGWMLRVAPIRQPIILRAGGVWEEYCCDVNPSLKNKKRTSRYDEDKNNPNDAAANSSQQQQQTFYFNRATFETTYEAPPEVMAELYQLQQQQEQEQQYELDQQQQYDNQYRSNDDSVDSAYENDYSFLSSNNNNNDRSNNYNNNNNNGDDSSNNNNNNNSDDNSSSSSNSNNNNSSSSSNSYNNSSSGSSSSSSSSNQYNRSHETKHRRNNHKSPS